MKKILFILVMLLTTMASMAQFRDNVNVSLFGGGYIAQQNTNNQGSWYGIYLDYMPIKTPGGFNLGIAALASQSLFKSNDSQSMYQGTSTDFGAGLAIGKYAEFFTLKHSAYLGADVMVKKSSDEGHGETMQSNRELGYYDMDQNDLLISTSINFNLLKNYGLYENLFPRTQLRLFYQKPLESKKNSFWNNIPIKESALWNKASYGAEFKQSLVQIGRYDFKVEPKAYLGYYHYDGDNSNWLGIGPELAFKMQGKDDFLSFYFLVKKQVGDFEENLNSTLFVFGINFMPFNIRRNY